VRIPGLTYECQVVNYDRICENTWKRFKGVEGTRMGETRECYCLKPTLRLVKNGIGNRGLLVRGNR